MRKTLAVLVSSALIGCASPEPERAALQPGEQVLRLVTPEMRDLALTFYEQLLLATDISPQDIAGHVTNLNALEGRICSAQKITPDTHPSEQLRAIHQYLFDHNSHRFAREAPASELYELAKIQHVICRDLEKGQQRAGSELGLALEFFVLSRRLGLEITPYLVTQNRAKHIIFSGYGSIIDPTSPTGIRDEQPIAGERLTPANLLGLLLNTKGTREVMTGDASSGYQTLQRAYSLFSHADVSLNLAETAVFLGNHRLARQWFEQTTRLDQKNPLPHERLGDLSSRENNYERAAVDYMRALEFDASSTNARLYFKYGETQLALNRFDEATVYLRRAREIAPYDQKLCDAVDQYIAACKVR